MIYVFYLDKALVEGVVKIVYTSIYTSLPKEPYTSFGALNKDIWNFLEKELNGIIFSIKNYNIPEKVFCIGFNQRFRK